MKLKKLLIVGLISSLLGGWQLVGVTLAATNTSSVYVSPTSQTVTNGSLFNVQVRTNIDKLDSGDGQGITTNLSFSRNTLQVAGMSASGNSFPVAPQQSFNNSNGTINIFQDWGNDSKPIGDFLLTTITFRAVALGGGSVTVTYAEVGHNESAARGSGSYSIVTPPPVVTPPPSAPPPSGGSSSPSFPSSSTPIRSSSSGTSSTPGSSTSSQPTSTSDGTATMTSNGSLAIGNVTSTILYDKAALTWQSNAAATYTVRYGTILTKLTMSKKITKAGTSGQIELTKLIPGTRYYYEIDAATGDGQAAQYQSQLTTQGLPVVISVLDSKNKPINQALVTIGQKEYRTDKTGKVRFDSATGTFNAVISTKSIDKKVSFTVKASAIGAKPTDTPTTQTFTFVMDSSPLPWLILGGVGAFIIILIAALFALRRYKQPSNTATVLPAPEPVPVPPAVEPLAEPDTPGLFPDLAPASDPIPSVKPAVPPPPPPSAPEATTVAPQQSAPQASSPELPQPTSPPAPPKKPAQKRYNSVYLDEEEPEDVFAEMEERFKDKLGK